MPVPDRLYRNRGDGTFADVTAAAQVAREFGPAMGVVAADLDADGWPDLYVANDMQENQLWINRQDGTFVNDALLAGVALNQAGGGRGGHGRGRRRHRQRRRRRPVPHPPGGADQHALRQRRRGDGSRTAARCPASGATSVPSTGFGALWFDYDNDGWLDVLAVNGAVTTIKELVEAGEPHPLRQPNQLFHNLGGGRFADVTAEAGAAFALSEVSRGAAFGDLDNDGDIDVVVTNNAGPVRLLVNEVGSRNRWLGLRLVGGDPPRDMLGARVGVFRAGGPPLWRRARTDGSYASAHDPRVLVGLGSAASVERVAGRLAGWAGRGMDRPGSEPVPDADRGDGDGAERTAVVCVVERRGARHGIGRRSRPGRTE